MSAPDDNGAWYIELPSGLVIPGRRLTWNDGSVRWDGNKAVAAPPPAPAEAAELDRFSTRVRAIEEAGGEAAVVERRSD